MVRALTWVFGVVSLRTRQMKAWLARKRLGIEIFPRLQSSFDHANSLFRPRITLQGCVGSLSTDATHGASIRATKLAPPFKGDQGREGCASWPTR